MLNKIKEQSNTIKQKYSGKYVTPDEAVKVIKSGDRVYIQSGCAYPQRLVEAMSERKDELQDVELCHLMVFGEAPYMKPEMEGHFRHNGFFLGGNTRKQVKEGKADFMPIFLSEIPKLIRHDTKHKVDVVLIQVSPPDMHGFCSMGVAVDCTKAAVHVSKYVIAQINPMMPRVHGDSFIHINDIDFAFEYEQPLQELPGAHSVKSPEETAIFQKIGQNIADLIEDGSTLQMGIGAIPDAVLGLLGDKKDLGIHTEMFSDGVIPLVESGVINCDKKTLLKERWLPRLFLVPINFLNIYMITRLLK